MSSGTNGSYRDARTRASSETCRSPRRVDPALPGARRPISRDESGRSGCGRFGRPGPVGGLKQLDQVAVWVGEQDLTPAGAGDQVAAERQVRAAEPGDLGIQVFDDEVDAVAARSGGVIRGGAGAGAGRSGQQQPERTTDNVGKGGCGAGVQLEAKVCGVEVDGGLHVVNEVADAGVLLRCGHG